MIVEEVNIKTDTLSISKKLVGKTITEENLQYVDAYMSKKLAIYTPIGGCCGYAVSPNHTHPSYMFSLPYDSETILMVRGKRVETAPNTLFALSPEIEHSEIQNYLPPKYSAIFIDKLHFEEAFSLYQEEKPFFDAVSIFLKDNRLYKLVNEFKFEAQNSFEGREVLLESLANLLTHQIIRTLLDRSTQSFYMSDNIAIGEAIKYLNRHFNEEVTVETLAKYSSLSKSHFTKLFGTSMGISPMEYLKNIRLQHAKKLLIKGDENITQVSLSCGFKSSAYFTKLFRERYGVTPSEFMKHHK
jgi:AraC-like DNA-binding protein